MHVLVMDKDVIWKLEETSLASTCGCKPMTIMQLSIRMQIILHQKVPG